MAKRKSFRFKDVHGFLQALFGEDVHAKRVDSLANATLGVMTNASLAIHLIGDGLAPARGLLSNHAIKQVDRLLSKSGHRGRGPVCLRGAAQGGGAQSDRGGDGLDRR